MADEWDRFPDAPGAATSPSPQAAPQPQDQPRTLPAGSDGGYSIDPETGHLVIHFGGQKFRPVEGDRPDIGNLPLRAVSPEMDRRVEALRFNEAQRGSDRLSVPGPVEDGREMPMPAGREPPRYPAVPQFIKDHVDVGDIVDNPGRHAVGAARTAPMLMGMTGGPAGAFLDPAKRAAEPVVDLATRALTASPKTTGTAAAGTAITVGAGEAGNDPKAEAAAKQASDDHAAMESAGKQLETAMQQRQSLDQQRSVATAERDAELKGKGGKTAGRGKNYEAKEAEISRLSSEMERLDATISDMRRRSSPEYVEYVKKVREAEGARQDILDKSRKDFEEAHPDWAAWQFTAPAVLGGITALALRLKPAIDARGQAGRWWDAVQAARDTTATPAARAEARRLASEMESKLPAQTWKDIAKSYGLPAGISSGEGAFASNFPEFYNLFLPADNPKRKAYEAYMERLPEGHPEIERTQKLLEKLPVDNPARRAAIEHFVSLKPAILRGIEGAGEAAAAASFITTLTKAVAPTEAGLPRAETKALVGAAADRARPRAPSPVGPQGPGGQPILLQASPSPGDTSRLALPPPANAVQPPTTIEQRLAPPANTNNATIESWRTPQGEVIKRGKSGGTWHDDKGNFSSPPPKGSKRLSELDSQLYYGGFA